MSATHEQPVRLKETFFIDCEFDGHGGPLMSIAVVRGDGQSLYVRIPNVAAADPWVEENVLPNMDYHFADVAEMVHIDEVGPAIRRFLGNSGHPIIIADSPVDVARFCAAISTGADGGWAPTMFERMTFEVHNVDSYPTDLPGAVQHNAWWDAMALRHLAARDDNTGQP